MPVSTECAAALLSFRYPSLIICIYSVYTAKFGPWELGPQHGFARISQWKVAEEPKVCSKIEKSHQLTCMAA